MIDFPRPTATIHPAPGGVAANRLRAASRRLAPPVLAFLLVALAPGPVSAESGPGRAGDATPPELRRLRSSGSYCTPLEETPPVVLDSLGVEAIVARMCSQNLRVWTRTDSIYRSGRFGKPGSDAAARRARWHFQLRVLTAFDYLTDAAAESRIRVASEEALIPPLGNRYANTAVYPIRALQRALVGAGGFCLEYDLSRCPDGVSLLGGVPTRIRPDRIAGEDGIFLPAQSLEFMDRIHKSVTLVYKARFCGKASREVIVDRGDTLDLTTVSEVEGLYARKAGTHRMTAMIIWRSHTRGDLDPQRPRLGACAYFPHIAIRLPAFLPDIGLADLRGFDLPNPIVSLAWGARHERLDWIETPGGTSFEPWEGAGPCPMEVERRFPDL
jgi:hypothetical protein